MADTKEPTRKTKKPASKFALKNRQLIEATHPHTPAISWCRKCVGGN